MSLPVYETVAQMRAAAAEARRAGRRIGVVPTMGALHEGHLSLVRAAARETDFVVVTIFVNPTQFGPNEDFHRYPRQLEADCHLVRQAGAQAVFAPSIQEMYPPGFATYVQVTGLEDKLEGIFRPGHFRGVATVVLKLFNIVSPDVAFFGQKDAQQARLIGRMVDDLNLPVTVRVMPTVREPDGLAMSSRNVYLSADQRRQATALSQSLALARRLVAEGQRCSAAVVERMRGVLAAVPHLGIDYIAVVDPDTFDPVDRIESEVLVALAVRLGATRLIDNERIDPRKKGL